MSFLKEKKKKFFSPNPGENHHQSSPAVYRHRNPCTINTQHDQFLYVYDTNLNHNIDFSVRILSKYSRAIINNDILLFYYDFCIPR